MIPYAELIGDPVAHSRSPAIHKFWLGALGLEGDYRATQVRAAELAAYLEKRKQDPDWRGCSVTAPHKRTIIPFLDELSPEAAAVGAVNCVMPTGDRLIGFNTDIDGVAEALAPLERHFDEAAIIGGGGAACAAASHLRGQGCKRIHLLLRDPGKAADFPSTNGATEIVAHRLDEPGQALKHADILINASPLGMSGLNAPLVQVLVALRLRQRSMIVFDMVYDPEETLLLQTARQAGHQTVGGLDMLVGQARHAFWMFFGNNTPRARDDELRRSLAGGFTA